MDILQSGGLSKDELLFIKNKVTEEGKRQKDDVASLHLMLTELNSILKGMNSTRNDLDIAQNDLKAKEAGIDFALKESKVSCNKMFCFHFFWL